MTGPDKIMASAQAGLRNLAASLARSTPDETVPHKRVPRRVLHAQDKLYCEIVNSNPLLWGETKRPRHARRPGHAKEGAERRAKQKALRTAATVTQDREQNTTIF